MQLLMQGDKQRYTIHSSHDSTAAWPGQDLRKDVGQDLVLSGADSHDCGKVLWQGQGPNRPNQHRANQEAQQQK